MLAVSAREGMVLLQSFSSLWQLAFKRPLWLVLFCYLAWQAFKGPTWLRSFSVAWSIRKLMPPPTPTLLGNFSIAWHVKHLKGHSLWGLSLLVSAGMWGDRGYSDGSTPCAWFSIIALCLWLFWFLPTHSPSWSPPSCPLGPSSQSQQQTSPWDCSPIPMLELPAPAHSRVFTSLFRVHRAVARIVCVVLIPFRLSQISWCTFQQLQILLQVPRQLPQCGNLTPASISPPPGCRSSPD